MKKSISFIILINTIICLKTSSQNVIVCQPINGTIIEQINSSISVYHYTGYSKDSLEFDLDNNGTKDYKIISFRESGPMMTQVEEITAEGENGSVLMFGSIDSTYQPDSTICNYYNILKYYNCGDTLLFSQDTINKAMISFSDQDNLTHCWGGAPINNNTLYNFGFLLNHNDTFFLGWMTISKDYSFLYIHEYGINSEILYKKPVNSVIEDVHIYPNPASTYIILEGESLPEPRSLEYELINNLGQHEQIEIEENYKQSKIKINKLRNGIYYLKIKGKKGEIITKKIVIIEN